MKVARGEGPERSVDAPAQDLRPLSVPDVEPVTFARNTIRTAVVELKFPTLLEFETQPPTEIQHRLRKDYPQFSKRKAVNIGSGTVEEEIRYVLGSRDGSWSVAIRPSAIALESTKYTTFEEMLARLQLILSVSKKQLDTDFFTRVGLRYVNLLPVPNASFDGWLNPDLIRPLAGGTYGTVSKYWQEVRGRARSGKYSFRHGLPEEMSAKEIRYVLDIDLFSENIEYDDAIGLLGDFHRESFAFFSWCIGPAAREYLGRAEPKQDKNARAR
jgi:uncharacterized protein (TIGR04255 family)